MTHEHDEDCTVVEGSCIVCGVSHGHPCPLCGKRGFHAEGCAEVEPRHDVSAPND